MARPPKFSREALISAAVALASAGGPGAVTMQGVAAATGAGSGSVYHRFAARGELLAEVWLEVLGRFQADWWARVAEATDPGDAAAAVVAWARRHRHAARVLLLHPREDFVGTDTPPELRGRVAAIDRETGARFLLLSERFLGSRSPVAMERAVFALATVPVAVVRRPLSAGGPITARMEALVRDAAVGVLRGGCSP